MEATIETDETKPKRRRKSRRGREETNGESKGAGGQLFRAIGYLGRYPKLTLFAIAALMLAIAAQLAVPQMVQRAIDLIIVEDGSGFTESADTLMRGVWIACGTIALFAAARGIFAFAQAYSSQILSQDIAFELRNDLFERIQRLSFSYHDRNQTGQLMIRATDDVERLRGFIGQGFLLAIQAILLLVGTLVVLFLTNVRLTLVVLPVLPIALVVFGLFGAIVIPLFSKVQKRLSAVNTILQENLSGLKLVKAFAREEPEQAKFNEASAALRDQRITISSRFSLIFPFFFLVANLGQAAILYFGGRQIIDPTMNLTLGEWQKFSLYLVYLFFPMGQLGFIISLAAEASASAVRIFDILDTENDITDKPDAVKLGDVRGHVQFDNVSFRYFSSSDDVLNDLTIDAEPGQTVALLGMTGSGKTTVINLIPRFYDVSEGNIKIDGHDVRDVTLDSLRQHIGIVLQETTLFSGTIRENIAFGRPSASQDEVETAAKAASAHDFIMSFPDGYNTRVGERGSTLSGGQKQRVAIARALLVNPSILIMDDSTSSVDYETEFRIQQALDELMEGRTSFVIAQRISTVVNADQILILDKGQIVARGTHDKLLENNAIYAEIYHSQLA